MLGGGFPIALYCAPPSGLYTLYARHTTRALTQVHTLPFRADAPRAHDGSGGQEEEAPTRPDAALPCLPRLPHRAVPARARAAAVDRGPAVRALGLVADGSEVCVCVCADAYFASVTQAVVRT